MSMMKLFIIAVVSYLCGSFSSSVVVSRTFLKKDLREYGSGNAGLTNSYRLMGGKLTLLVLVGDVLKAVIGVGIGGWLMGPLGRLIAGAFVIVGHMFPVFFGFRGGKGVLTGATMLLLFDWRVFAIAFALFVLSVAITRWVSLGSILGALSFPITTFIFYHDVTMTILAALMGGAVIVAHHGNIGRILSGTERRFTFGGKHELTDHREE
ncbi:MAG: glycerol-3-phosphate 1-O-acyltransferase PlsY [Butyricicoccus sp.]|nr:glycerol-3-phosphate 1-O-acyltransferase PlsY [Butyricicoccus sp.]